MPRTTTRYALLSTFLLAALLHPLTATALTVKREAAGATVTVYAPDWIWQGENVNVLFVIDNHGEGDLTASAHWSLPEALWPAKDIREKHTPSQTVKPGESRRLAITNVRVPPATPPGKLDSGFSVTVNGTDVEIAYPLRVVRGAAIDPSKAAAGYVWALIAATWCIVFLIVLPRFAKKGAGLKVNTIDVSDE